MKWERRKQKKKKKKRKNYKTNELKNKNLNPKFSLSAQGVQHRSKAYNHSRKGYKGERRKAKEIHEHDGTLPGDSSNYSVHLARGMSAE